MNCKTAHKWIHAKLDEELDSTHQTALQAHLAQCKACRRVAKQLEELVQIMKPAASEPSATPPPELWIRVQAEMEARPPGPGAAPARAAPLAAPGGLAGWWPRAGQWAWMALAAVVGLLVGGVLYFDAFARVSTRHHRISRRDEATASQKKKVSPPTARIVAKMCREDPEKTLVSDAFNVTGHTLFALESGRAIQPNRHTPPHRTYRAPHNRGGFGW